METINTFSLRSECKHDTDVLMTVLRRQSPFNTEVMECHPQSEDRAGMVLEFKTDRTLEEIQRLIGCIADSHVMYETLRQCPLAENPLERTHQPNPFQSG